MKLERLGVPTVSICTRPFQSLAESMARSLGMPKLRIVYLEERLADRLEPEIEALGIGAVDEVIAAFTGS